MNGMLSKAGRTVAAFLILVVFLGIVVYDVLTPQYEMPPPLWGLGIAVVSFMLGIHLPTIIGRRNGGSA